MNNLVQSSLVNLSENLNPHVTALGRHYYLDLSNVGNSLFVYAAIIFW